MKSDQRVIDLPGGGSNGIATPGAAPVDAPRGEELETGRSRLDGHLRTLRRNPDLALVALLLLLVAVFARSFPTSIQVGPVYLTEIILALAGAAALIRLGLAASWPVLRRLPLPALAVFWALGLIATARGLAEFGLTFVSEDVGLGLYSLVVPLVALVAIDRSRFDALFAVLVACGFAAMAAFGLDYAASQITGQENALLPIQGAAAGLYMSFAVAWVATRLVYGVATPNWLIGVAAGGLVLMFLTSQRSVLIVAIAALGSVVLLAPRARMLRAAIVASLAVVVAFAVAVGVQSGITTTLGGVEGSAENSPSSSGDRPQLQAELGGVDGVGAGAESENVRWRVAYWEELVSRTPDAPLLGVGFGMPSAFVWEGKKYDFRDGDPKATIDAVGPHNAFINILYRMGIPALVALLFVFALAALRAPLALRLPGTSARDRVVLVTLAAMLAGAAISSSFNEGLTVPFFALFFWAPLALLLIWPAVRAPTPPMG